MTSSQDKPLTLSQVTEWLNVAEGRSNLSATVRPDPEQQRALYRLAISALSSTTRIMGYDLGRPGGDKTVVTCRVVDRIEECATPNLCPLAGKCQRSATEAQEARIGGLSGANQQNGRDR